MRVFGVSVVALLAAMTKFALAQEPYVMGQPAGGHVRLSVVEPGHVAITRKLRSQHIGTLPKEQAWHIQLRDIIALSGLPTWALAQCTDYPLMVNRTKFCVDPDTGAQVSGCQVSTPSAVSTATTQSVVNSPESPPTVSTQASTTATRPTVVLTSTTAAASASAPAGNAGGNGGQGSSSNNGSSSGGRPPATTSSAVAPGSSGQDLTSLSAAGGQAPTSAAESTGGDQTSSEGANGGRPATTSSAGPVITFVGASLGPGVSVGSTNGLTVLQSSSSILATVTAETSSATTSEIYGPGISLVPTNGQTVLESSSSVLATVTGSVAILNGTSIAVGAPIASKSIFFPHNRHS
ncbi:hypothetical protein MNV49_004128 [Pseudohyphozyma bogoriensis]|nr:hypothetical protein MNV49_004128 [Pseudohyphozyma bogoriensis]